MQNYAELKRRLAESMAVFAGEMEKQGTDKNIIAKARDRLTYLFNSRECVEQLATQEAHVFFMLFGRTYQLRKPKEYEDRLPNPLGGNPLPCQIAWLCKTIDTKSGRAVITWKCRVHREEGRRIMERTLRELAERLGELFCFNGFGTKPGSG